LGFEGWPTSVCSIFGENAGGFGGTSDSLSSVEVRFVALAVADTAAASASSPYAYIYDQNQTWT